jgi:hypothetical protein
MTENRPSRGVYYVKNEDLAEFMKGVDSDFHVCVVMFRWTDTEHIPFACSTGNVLEWMVVLQ